MVSDTTLKDVTELYLECIDKFQLHNGVLYWNSTLKVAGHSTEKGYIQVRLNDKLYLAHRLIFLMTNKYLPDLVDHIDRNPRNNCPDNLREGDKRLNAINTGLPSNNTSGIKGVSWHKAGKKWTSQIKDKGVKIHLGCYDTLEEACNARRKAEGELWNDIK